MTYRPEPIDTSDVKIPDALLPLTEEIAKQVHEVWALGRLSDGWTWGEKRDDEKKTTPCLVPYEALPEEEKAYDRETAFGTVRLLLKLGCRIEKD